ncbi:MAG: hypothetical protein U9R15_00820 [Chloroflexota bacterium]|nr:hypothetical protein [Chloroflexota bacterium]
MGQESIDDLLREGIGAAKSGQRERARDLLMRVVERAEENVAAWLWLSGVVDGLEDQEICLENVLALDPDNAHARNGLAWVRRQAVDSESPVVARTRTPISPAAAMLRAGEVGRQTSPERDAPADSALSIAAMLHDEVESHQLPPAPEPLPPVTTRSEFDDEYLCPYCAAPTEPDDRKCKACGGSLWVKFRRQEKRSKWLWLAMALQLPNLLGSMAGFGLMLIYVATQVGVDDPFDLLHVYLGLPGQVPPDVAAAALELLPRFYFFAAALPVLVSVTVFIGLYLRWRPVYYVYWISAVLGFVVSVLAMFLQRGFGMISGGVGAFFAFLMLLLVFRLEDDFKVEKRRILLRLDRGLGNVADFLTQGDLYARQNKWAMAAIHLRQAVGFAPGRPGPRIALAVIYIRLKRYDRAVRELDEVDRISPGVPRVEELRGLVHSLRSRDNPPA